MRTALIFLTVTIIIVLLFWWKLVMKVNDQAVWFHFHDTYFVIAHSHVILIVISFLGSLSALGGAIGTGFRNKFFLIALTVFVLADAYVIWTIYPILKNL